MRCASAKRARNIGAATAAIVRMIAIEITISTSEKPSLRIAVLA